MVLLVCVRQCQRQPGDGGHYLVRHVRHHDAHHAGPGHRVGVAPRDPRHGGRLVRHRGLQPVQLRGLLLRRRRGGEPHQVRRLGPAPRHRDRGRRRNLRGLLGRGGGGLGLLGTSSADTGPICNIKSLKNLLANIR